MFWTRLFSGIILVLLALFAIIFGGNVLLLSVGIISLIGVFELYRVIQKEKSLIAFAGYSATFVYYLLLKCSPDMEWRMLLSLGFLIVLLIFYVFLFPKYRAEDIMFSFFGFFYVSVMLSYIYQTRMLENGAYIVWLIFICSWGSDTCAYCVGNLLGKHKMAPNLSPKKSMEGAVGGILGAGIIGALYAYCVGMDHFSFGVICAAGSLTAIVGDLAASAIKRNHAQKDYGTLIPGHGGILDRFDSVIFTAPMIYFLAVMII